MGIRYNRLLGDKTGVPDVPEEYKSILENAPLFPSSNIRKGFEKTRIDIIKHAWWKKYRGSKECKEPLREASSVIAGK